MLEKNLKCYTCYRQKSLLRTYTEFKLSFFLFNCFGLFVQGSSVFCVDLYTEFLFSPLFHNPGYSTWDFFIFLLRMTLNVVKKCKRTQDNRPGGYEVKTCKNMWNFTEQKHHHSVLFISPFHPQLAVNDFAWNIFLRTLMTR